VACQQLDSLVCREKCESRCCNREEVVIIALEKKRGCSKAPAIFPSHAQYCFCVSYVFSLCNHDLDESLLELRVEFPMLFKGLVTREDEEQQTDSRNVREDKRSLLNRATSKYGVSGYTHASYAADPQMTIFLAILVKRQQIILVLH
jgi:hypothetical protein